ncbi:MAG: protein TolQ [Immundisolibacterales bacterium]|nr:protein TolQ [Immundisolibacterales bacterium]
MAVDLSIVRLVLGASIVVQLVMLVLLVTSVVSWALIFRKRGVLAHARRETADFESRFWSGTDLVSMYNSINNAESDPGGMGSIFRAGFREYARLRRTGIDQRDVIYGSERAMRVAMRHEVDDLESHLSFLATVGSTSPYVGLFGTVWGIMNSFTALGNVGQATLAMVAPGIAEALIATAMGLFAAIPAVIAYNRYLSDVEWLSNRFSTFVEEFSTILQRQRVG